MEPEQSALPRAIAFVGMPGGGKSTVGRHVARLSGRVFVDTDAEIERQLGEPIRSFFAREGEGAFRDVEQRVMAEVLARPAPGGAVIATGGGAVLRPENREALKRGAIVVYLHSSPHDLARRLRHDTKRPLLQVADPRAALRELHQQRDRLYRDVAHYVIETGRPSVATLVNMVMMQLELAGLLTASAPPSPPPPTCTPTSAP